MCEKLPEVASEKFLVEACVASIEGAQFAVAAGADRIELNLALELDGLTPSAGLLKKVTESVQVPVIAMARPRAGDFVYSATEWATLLADADFLLSNGATGVAFGCLDDEGAVDIMKCRQLKLIAGAGELVFHKAFDVTSDWKASLDALIDVGVNRVMTSGQQPTAVEGMATITEMVKFAAGRIEVLPAGGVNSQNAIEIVSQTGVNQIHGSFSSGTEENIWAEVDRTVKVLAAQTPAKQ